MLKHLTTVAGFVVAVADFVVAVAGFAVAVAGLVVAAAVVSQPLAGQTRDLVGTVHVTFSQPSTDLSAFSNCFKYARCHGL